MTRIDTWHSWVAANRHTASPIPGNRMEITGCREFRLTFLRPRRELGLPMIKAGMPLCYSEVEEVGATTLAEPLLIPGSGMALIGQSLLVQGARRPETITAWPMTRKMLSPFFLAA